jgi:NADH dehydrogenase FAD-containing subunit
MDNGKANPDVWAIGDAAQVMDEPLPATAQGKLEFFFLLNSTLNLPHTVSVAVQKATYVVKKVNKQIKDRDSPEPFAFQSRGSLAYIGNWSVSIELRNRRFLLTSVVTGKQYTIDPRALQMRVS